MITHEALIADFQTMLRDKWGYIPATAGEVWTQGKQDRATSEMARKYGSRWIGHRVADCSGAFVWAYKQHGLSIYHGSNRIARKYVKELLPIAKAQPGMAAFKARKPGEQLYDLFAEYKQGGKYYTGDLNDYYHIGLIDTDPRYVLNSRSTVTGFVRSKIADGWDYCGYLKAVTYEGSEKSVEKLYEATVTSINGKGVNLRSTPNRNAKIITTLPVGTVVDVLAESDTEWAEVRSGDKTGYIMRMYLEHSENQQVSRLRTLLSEMRTKLDEADILIRGL